MVGNVIVNRLCHVLQPGRRLPVLSAAAVPTFLGVGASYGKLDPGHEEACYELKKQACSGRVIREKLAAGYNGLDPVRISTSRANQVAKQLIEERDELYASNVQNRPAHEGLRLLTKRLMIIAERETLRLEKAEKRGKLDANKLGRLATALVKLHQLNERNEVAPPDAGAANNGDSAGEPATPTGLAASILAEDAVPSEPEAPPQPAGGAPAPIADVPVPPPSTAPAPPPGPGQAVPSDPPHHRDGNAGGNIASESSAVAVGDAA